MSIFNNLKNSVDNYINEKKKARADYERVIETSNIFVLDKDIPKDEENIVESNIYEYNDMCAYLNLKKSKNIDYVIPVDETVINIVDLSEKKTEKKYLMILTDKRIIIMNTDKYKDYTYESVSDLKLMNKGLMTQTIYFDRNAIDVNLNYQDLLNVYNTITKIDYRNQIINTRKAYLCNITPTYQKINKIASGITIGTNNEIVFHNRKKENYPCKVEDILNYELMEDNTVIREKPKKEKSQAIGFAKKECYEMSIRVTLTNNTQFKITILEMNNFNNSYNHSNNLYNEAFEFAKELMDKLDTYYQV